jgi:hypothetical protein
MGLDMYLKGNKFFWTDWQNTENNRMEDGFKISDLNLLLGYWRKHPNLHGYIVQTLANGLDECQEISLDVDQLKNIIQAVKEKRLPATTGFFFGTSELSEAEIADDVKQLEAAIAWLEMKEPRVSRSIFYQASW